MSATMHVGGRGKKSEEEGEGVGLLEKTREAVL
jgi:hypothetical protein